MFFPFVLLLLVFCIPLCVRLSIIYPALNPFFVPSPPFRLFCSLCKHPSRRQESGTKNRKRRNKENEGTDEPNLMGIDSLRISQLVKVE